MTCNGTIMLHVMIHYLGMYHYVEKCNEVALTCNGTIMLHVMIHYWGMYHYVEYGTVFH